MAFHCTAGNLKTNHNNIQMYISVAIVLFRARFCLHLLLKLQSEKYLLRFAGKPEANALKFSVLAREHQNELKSR
jgi:hypothetical protein